MNNQSPNNGNNNSNHKKNGNGQMILMFLLITLVALFFMSMFSRWQQQMTTKEISYTEFLQMVEEDKVEEVRVSSNSYRITPKGNKNELVPITYFTGIAGNDLELVALLKEHDVKYYPYIPDDSATWVYNILSILLPILLLWAVMGFLMKKMGSGMGMGVGKSTAKVYVEKKTGVTFKDVAGQDEAKESLQEVVDFLHNPQKYTDIGAKLPKGALLVGPPGTGKTLLAKAVAGEANVPFFSLAGSDFVEMFVGVGASRVRDLFKEAQKQAPCIIFIDEIDAIGKSRDTRYGSGNDEREQTLNQLLSEMDGFDTSKGLLILAATNRPEVLDKALLRPGRFDRRIIVEKPDLKGRIETLKVHSKDVLMDETVDLDAIALATSGAVGSDLANMINEAAINAVKRGRKYVNQSDLFESVEVVIAGKEKKDRILGKEEKRIVAYHEVGHALTTALQKNAEPVQKITIVPRTMGALGYVMQVPEEEKYLMSEEELKARLVTFMAGRAAEEIVFHSITTGASNDIEKATQIARAMVTQYGMSKKFGLISLESVENRYLDGRPVLNCGDNTAAEIDQEVQLLLKDSYETAKKLLEENRDVLDKIAEYLFEHETITGKEFMRIYREIKGIPQPPEDEEEEKAGGLSGVQISPQQPAYAQGAVPVNPSQGQAGSMPVNPVQDLAGSVPVNPSQGQAGSMPVNPVQDLAGGVPVNPAQVQTGSMPSNPGRPEHAPSQHVIYGQQGMPSNHPLSGEQPAGQAPQTGRPVQNAAGQAPVQAGWPVYTQGTMNGQNAAGGAVPSQPSAAVHAPHQVPQAQMQPPSADYPQQGYVQPPNAGRPQQGYMQPPYVGRVQQGYAQPPMHGQPLAGGQPQGQALSGNQPAQAGQPVQGQPSQLPQQGNMPVYNPAGYPMQQAGHGQAANAGQPDAAREPVFYAGQPDAAGDPVSDTGQQRAGGDPVSHTGQPDAGDGSDPVQVPQEENKSAHPAWEQQLFGKNEQKEDDRK